MVSAVCLAQSLARPLPDDVNGAGERDPEQEPEHRRRQHRPDAGGGSPTLDSRRHGCSGVGSATSRAAPKFQRKAMALHRRSLVPRAGHTSIVRTVLAQRK